MTPDDQMKPSAAIKPQAKAKPDAAPQAWHPAFGPGGKRILRSADGSQTKPVEEAAPR